MPPKKITRTTVSTKRKMPAKATKRSKPAKPGRKRSY